MLQGSICVRRCMKGWYEDANECKSKLVEIFVFIFRQTNNKSVLEVIFYAIDIDIDTIVLYVKVFFNIKRNKISSSFFNKTNF